MLASKTVLRRSNRLLLGQSPLRLIHSHKHVERITAIEASSVLFGQDTYEKRRTYDRFAAAAFLLAGGTALAASSTISRTNCEGDVSMLHMNQPLHNQKSPSAKGKTSKQKAEQPQHHWTPAEVAREDFDSVIESHESEDLPVYTSDQVAENDGEDGRPIWMSYGGYVYDVTAFIKNHPGGSEKIMMAAGSVSCRMFSFFYGSGFVSCLQSSSYLYLFFFPLVDRTILALVQTTFCLRLAYQTDGTHGHW